MKRLLLGIILSLMLRGIALGADEWLPITKDDLECKAPGGEAAVVLYKQQDTDLKKHVTSLYVRTKIFTPSSTDAANVTIPYWKGHIEITDLRARTIRPDGSIVPFNGQVYDKLLARQRSVKIWTRAFTFPEVQPGSIIEYQWRYKYESGGLVDWDIQEKLPIRHARFTVTIGDMGLVTLRWRLTSLGQTLTKREGDKQTLELRDIPAFQEEPYMPPESWTRMSVHFYVQPFVIGDFWTQIGKYYAQGVEESLKKHGEVDKLVRSLVQPSDTTDAKLRKLYAAAQRVRNLSYEPERTEKEQKEFKENKTVDDILKHGYGRGNEIDQLYVAMLRSAGIRAWYAYLASRARYAFRIADNDIEQISAAVVIADDGGKQVYLDPASHFCPYGLLPWSETGVHGLRLDADSGTWIVSPEPKVEDAVTSRKATLHIEGTDLVGKLSVAFTGLEALRWRNEHALNDRLGQKQALEDEVRSWFPSGAKIETLSEGPWDTSEGPLAAEFNVTIPGAVARTGKRILLTNGVLQLNDKPTFEAPERKLPIYFSYPFAEADEISIEVPSGYRLESPPQRRYVKEGFASYERTYDTTDKKIVMTRRFELQRYVYLTKSYPELRAFYSKVQLGDHDNLVIVADTPPKP